MSDYDNKIEETLSDLGLDELKRTYDIEADRTRSLESKGSSILGFASLILTILIFILNYFFSSNNTIIGFNLFVILVTISIIMLVTSLFYLIDVFRIRVYPSPFDYNPDIIHDELIKPSNELKKNLLNKYRRAIPKIHAMNNQKAKSLDKSIKFLVIGITLSIISPLLLLWVKLIIIWELVL